MTIPKKIPAKNEYPLQPLLEPTHLFRYKGEIKVAYIYQVVTNSDLDEGKGHEVSLGYFLDKAYATKKASKAGVMGTDAEVRALQCFVVEYEGGTHLLGNLIEVETVDPMLGIFAKLTPEEAALLRERLQ